MTRFKSFDLSLFIVLALVMLITRSHSLSQFVHLPETSLATFFVAGFYIYPRLAMPALFLLGFAIDLVVINYMGVSNFCFTPAYWMLLPAYGVMWFAGRMVAHKFGASLASLPAIIITVCVAAFISNLFSSGGFYFLGGRFDDPSLSGFLPRIARYFPGTLLSTVTWTGVAAVCHIVAASIVSGQNMVSRK